jgi:hypothetical protein
MAASFRMRLESAITGRKEVPRANHGAGWAWPFARTARVPKRHLTQTQSIGSGNSAQSRRDS